MISLPADSIQIPSYRQRKEFDEEAIRELAESIEKHSLLHPIVIRQEGEAFFLVAGERRLRAITSYLWPLGGALSHSGVLYPTGEVPCALLGELDPLAAEEAECEENIRRVNYSWDERAAATARLAGLRQRQSAINGLPSPTIADISREVRESAGGSSADATRKEILIAPHLGDKAISGAKTLNDAWKILKRKEALARNEALALQVGRTFTSDVHTLLNEDCIDWMVSQPGEQFDIILTDPPYGIDAQDFGDAGGRLTDQTHEYDDSAQAWQELMTCFAPESFRLAKPQAHLYVCCDLDNFHELKGMFEDAGWRVHRTPIINYKTDGNRVPWPEHGPQRKWEMILYAVKGDRPVTSIYGDVVETRGDPNLGHGAQKPVELFRNLLIRSIRPGDTVLDPFCGTGTIFPAAHDLKIIATGIEKDPAVYATAMLRLKTLKEPV